MALQDETVAIPITKGVNLTTEARLVEPPHLLEAYNSRLSKGGGSRKRRGHLGVSIRNPLPIPPASLPGRRVFGWGLANSNFKRLTGDAVTCGISEFPDAGQLKGVAQRDQETVLWTGESLLSYAPGEIGDPDDISANVGNAVLPSLHATPVAKVQTSQIAPDIADNGIIKVVAWIDAAANQARYSVYDSISGATLVYNTQLAVSTPFQVRTIPMGKFVHILVTDQSNALLNTFSINQAIPTTPPIARSQGACTKHFDIWKVSESLAAVIKSNPNSGPGFLDIIYLGQDFTPFTGGTYTNFSLNGNAGLGQVCISVHPVTSRVLLGWVLAGQNLGFATATPSGTVIAVFGTPPDGGGGSNWPGYIASGGTFSTDSSVFHITAAPKLLAATTNDELWDTFWDYTTPGNGVYYNAVAKQRLSSTALIGSKLVRTQINIGSQAFRVGDRVFIWTGHPSALQSTWFISDENLDPVGHQDWAVANVPDYANLGGFSPPILATSHTTSVNWVTGDYTAPTLSNTVNTQLGGGGQFAPVLVDNTLFHTAMGYVVRVPSSSNTLGVFTEPSIKEVRLNFLPTLRHAQAGRCLYLAGAQVWSYDGAEVVEAGFHVGPELPPSLNGTPNPLQSAGGSLTALGTYFYRVDLCYKNAQGEEVRSLSIQTAPLVLTGGNQTITLTIPVCYTRRTNSYFLIFRNVMLGGSPPTGIPSTQLWLLNSRDPSSTRFLKNTQANISVTFVDDGTVFSDVTLQRNELHPANSGNAYLQPTAPPACEIIASGRDRVWVAGGELLPGQVMPSRLFSPGEAPTWNPYLGIQVDRSAEALTAIGFVGEVAAFFRKNATYVMDGDGPDNVSNGVWAPARLAFADLGALGQESLALATKGLVFQGPAGIRMMGPSGDLAPIGIPTDEYVKTFTISTTVVIDKDQEIRWYGPAGVLVYNYLHDGWSIWTVPNVGAVRDLATGLCLVAKSNGSLLIETDGVWTDAGTAYTHRIRFPWLHAGHIGDFQRVKSIEGIGTWSITDPPGSHIVRVELFYDQREFPEEWFEWTVPDSSQNTDTWGANHWGDGVWGDTNSTSGSITDSTWDWRRKPARQKCGVLSVAIEDKNTPGPGFTLNAIGLKLARKQGLNRTTGLIGGSDTFR